MDTMATQDQLALIHSILRKGFSYTYTLYPRFLANLGCLLQHRACLLEGRCEGYRVQ